MSEEWDCGYTENYWPRRLEGMGEGMATYLYKLH